MPFSTRKSRKYFTPTLEMSKWGQSQKIYVKEPSASVTQRGNRFCVSLVFEYWSLWVTLNSISLHRSINWASLDSGQTSISDVIRHLEIQLGGTGFFKMISWCRGCKQTRTTRIWRRLQRAHKTGDHLVWFPNAGFCLPHKASFGDTERGGRQRG